MRMNPSAVSRRVARLEDCLGFRLLHRTTRSVAVTEAGEQLLQRLTPLLQELDDALDAVSHGPEELAGTLRINASKGGARWLPVRQPEIYAGEVLRELARAQGVKLPEPLKGTGRGGGGRVIVRQQSEPLSRMCRDFLFYSNNLMAEMVGLAGTKARNGKVSTLKASAGEMSQWAGQQLGMKSSRFVDHSGLGDASEATAEDMALALVRARGVIEPLLKRFDMRDSKGNVMKNHPIGVHAKTGTLNFVSALAGYARAPDGTLMSFAIFAADESTRARIKRDDRESPRGARSWNRRAKGLQQGLIERWGALYGV